MASITWTENTTYFSILLVGLSPLFLTSAFNYSQTSKKISEFAEQNAKIVAKDKSNRILEYFNYELAGIVDLANNQNTSSALQELSLPFQAEFLSAANTDYLKTSIYKYYMNDFSQAYKSLSNKSFDVEKLVQSLDTPSIVAQYDFIVANKNPVGKKDLLNKSDRSGAYSKIHEKYHPAFREYLRRHSLYDLFLVNSSGRVVYTVFKESDFATSLQNGPWSNTGLAKAFQVSKSLKPGETYIEDFSAYSPSYEAPASFAAVPIFKENQYIGSLIIQLPIDKITEVASNRDGLGEKGETLLLGSDMRLRANTFRNKTTHNVASSFAEEKKVSIESEATRKAQLGREGFMENISYDGLKTLAYFMPIKINNLTWYTVTELSV